MAPLGIDRPTRLSREVVLLTALAIIDGEGVEAMSMRRLGQELGRDPMALYRYAANKKALLDGVVELLLGQLTIDANDPDWTGQFRKSAREFRLMAIAHRNMIPLLVTHPLVTPLALRAPSTLRPLEDSLALLTNAGLTDIEALAALRAFNGFLRGHILNEFQALIDNEEESEELLRLGLHRLPIREFPLLRGLAAELASYDGETELERGLDTLFATFIAQHDVLAIKIR
jgi:AcrR family transcriptional regulator